MFTLGKIIRKYFRILLGFVFGIFVAMLLVGGADLFDYDEGTASVAIIGIATLVGVVWHIQHNKNN